MKYCPRRDPQKVSKPEYEATALCPCSRYPPRLLHPFLEDEISTPLNPVSKKKPERNDIDREERKVSFEPEMAGIAGLLGFGGLGTSGWHLSRRECDCCMVDSCACS